MVSFDNHDVIIVVTSSGYWTVMPFDHHVSKTETSGPFYLWENIQTNFILATLFSAHCGIKNTVLFWPAPHVLWYQTHDACFQPLEYHSLWHCAEMIRNASRHLAFAPVSGHSRDFSIYESMRHWLVSPTWWLCACGGCMYASCICVS